MKGCCIYKTILGFIKICHEDDILTYLKLTNSIENLGERTYFTDNVIRELEEYFRGERKAFDLKYRLTGSEFQIKVWNALRNIPYGSTASYKDIACKIGNPNASRAVGNANNKNPITIIVPCHRVIGTNGTLTGYFGGIEAKKILLDIEKRYIK